MLRIEFFHSVVCSHCFIMSNRLRKIVKEFPEIEVIHRSYPLRWAKNEIKGRYDSKEAARDTMIRTWERANLFDDEHRFNIEGIRQADFEMPTARAAMIAIRAGVLAGSDKWTLFDHFQHALYVRCLNIDDEDVIVQLIEETDLDFQTWLKFYQSPITEKMEQLDFELAEKYELELIPALVVEEKHLIYGTKRLDLTIQLLKEAAKTEGIKLGKDKQRSKI